MNVVAVVNVDGVKVCVVEELTVRTVEVSGGVIIAVVRSQFRWAHGSCSPTNDCGNTLI